LHEINQHACAAIKGIACSSIPSNVQVVFWYGDTHDDPNAFHFSIYASIRGPLTRAA
jgi:hypothetical protein